MKIPLIFAAIACASILAGCSTSQSIARLDSTSIDDLMPTNEEVGESLGWADNPGFQVPDFSSFPADAEELVALYGGPSVIGEDCAQALGESGVMPAVPIGADEVTGNWWVERGVTIRELVLARYSSETEASNQVAHVPNVVEFCPTLNGAGGGRTLEVGESTVEGALILRASDSYSWVVASFANIYVQVKAGSSADEVASAEALVILQLDKLERIARGAQEPNLAADDASEWTTDQINSGSEPPCGLVGIDDLLIDLLGTPVHAGSCTFTSGTESTVDIFVVEFPEDLPNDAFDRVSGQCDYVNEKTDAWELGDKSCGTYLPLDPGYMGLVAIDRTYFRIIVDRVDSLPNTDRAVYGPLVEQILSRITAGT